MFQKKVFFDIFGWKIKWRISRICISDNSNPISVFSLIFTNILISIVEILSFRHKGIIIIERGNSQICFCSHLSIEYSIISLYSTKVKLHCPLFFLSRTIGHYVINIDNSPSKVGQTIGDLIKKSFCERKLFCSPHCRLGSPCSLLLKWLRWRCYFIASRKKNSSTKHDQSNRNFIHVVLLR